MSRPRVVVAGAGFGGLWVARALAREPVEVLLLDRNNYHTFLPLLYQVAAAELGPTEIAYPVRSIFRDAGNVEFRMTEVEGVDLDRKEVSTAVGPVSYDHLVLALGSVPHYFGVEGARQHAFPLRSMEQAIPLRHHILSRFEAAVYEEDPRHRRRLLTFAIVGGGPTGVEFAGALAELVYGPLRKDYPGLEVEEVRILLLEAVDGLLRAMPEKLGDYARTRLEEKGVEVRTGAQVSRVGPAGLLLADGEEMAAETVVWTAGVRGEESVEAWGLPVEREGRVSVEPTLQVLDRPHVWVVGDLAYLEDDDGAPLPQVAPVAIQEAEHVSMNLLLHLRGEDLRAFHFEDPGMLAVIGRNAGVAHVKGRAFTGFFAWVLWLLVHIVKLIGFRNRMLVLINWAWNYLSYEQAVRLILPVESRSRFRSGVEEEVEKEAEGDPEARLEEDPEDGGQEDPADLEEASGSPTEEGP